MKMSNMLNRVEDISYTRKRKTKSMEERELRTNVEQVILEEPLQVWQC